MLCCWLGGVPSAAEGWVGGSSALLPGSGLESMVITTQSAGSRNGLNRCRSARCFCCSVSRSRCCCSKRLCCSSFDGNCRGAPPCAPCVPPSPVPPNCCEIALTCSGDRPCRICSKGEPEVCP